MCRVWIARDAFGGFGVGLGLVMGGVLDYFDLFLSVRS